VQHQQQVSTLYYQSSHYSTSVTRYAISLNVELLLPYYHISSSLRHATFCYKADASHYSAAQIASRRVASHHIEPQKSATLRLLIITTAAERYIPGLPGARRPPLWTPSPSFIPHIHARLFLSHHLTYLTTRLGYLLAYAQVQACITRAQSSVFCWRRHSH
jgi:hypothetical protein